MRRSFDEMSKNEAHSIDVYSKCLEPDALFEINIEQTTFYYQYVTSAKLLNVTNKTQLLHWVARR